MVNTIILFIVTVVPAQVNMLALILYIIIIAIDAVDLNPAIVATTLG